MTYTVMVKFLASVVFTASMVASSTSVTMEYPATTTATTTPLVVAVVKKIVSDCGDYISLFEGYNWPTTTAMQICKDESKGNPEAINWTDSHKDSKGKVICMSSQGLMQIACLWPNKLGYAMGDLLDPEKNIEMAYQIWLKQGFKPWSTYKP